MRAYFIGLLLLASGCLCTSCQPAHLTPEELNRYVDDPDHGLQQHQQVGETVVAATYQPAELLVAREIQALEDAPLQVDSLRQKYSNAAYFLLSISRNGRDVLQPAEGFAQYSELLQTLAFHMDEQVRLVTSQGDTLRPTNYYLDRTTTGTHAAQLLLAFAKPASSGTWHLQLRECGLGTGNLSFAFETQQLQAVPALLVP